MRVMIVEDDRLSAELARDLLEAGGHEVELVGDAAGFRRALAKPEAPHVVLMDILLPDGDGVALLHEARRSSRLGGVPVVAVTAQALAGERLRLEAAGFTAILTKPIDTRRFVGEVERLANRG